MLHWHIDLLIFFLVLSVQSFFFLQDPWWNSAVEEQAVMRIHRIGQTKSVSIKRFIVKVVPLWRAGFLLEWNWSWCRINLATIAQGTVEERMEAVQARKQRMISGALTDQEFRTSRLEELKMLFSWRSLVFCNCRSENSYPPCGGDFAFRYGCIYARII